MGSDRGHTRVSEFTSLIFRSRGQCPKKCRGRPKRFTTLIVFRGVSIGVSRGSGQGVRVYGFRVLTQVSSPKKLGVLLSGFRRVPSWAGLLYLYVYLHSILPMITPLSFPSLSFMCVPMIRRFCSLYGSCLRVYRWFVGGVCRIHTVRACPIHGVLFLFCQRDCIV